MSKALSRRANLDATGDPLNAPGCQAYNGASFIIAIAKVQKVLVTGATGFVGAALCAEMRRRTMPFLPASRRSEHPGHFQTGDLDRSLDWLPALAGCNAVIHLAGRVHKMHEQTQDAMTAYQTVNVDATLALARQAASCGVRRFVFVSTVKVNGELTEARPFSAGDTPDPQDAYACSKWDAERRLTEFGAQTAMDIVIVRPPLVYGPGVRANFLRLMQLVHSGVPLPLGMVHNRRSFVSVDNLVDFLLLCTKHPGAANKTWLISDQRELGTAELIKLIAAAMGRRPLLLPIPPRLLLGMARMIHKDKAVSRLLGSLQVDAEPASHLLGWRPVLSVEEGIRRTVNHFLSQFA